MGSVPDLYTTGDNDPEIYPVSYYRHYLYCDSCGSFDLGSWTTPDDSEGIERTRTRLARMAGFVLPLVLVVAWFAREMWPPALVLVAGLIVLVSLLVVRGRLGSSIETVGMRCLSCGATYAHGTPFFTDLDANPHNLTVADVPRPLGVSPFLVGRSVETEPTKPGSRLSP